MKFLLALIIQILLATTLWAQSNDSTGFEQWLGKPFPNLKFDPVLNYSTSNLSIRDLKKKWVILDFWSVYCTSCVESMPRLNVLQLKYADHLQILLVGSKHDKIQPFFKKLIAKNHWILPSAFDSAVFKRFNIMGVPREIWIDDKGIIQAITDEQAVTDVHIQNFIRGIKFSYEKVSAGNPVKYSRFSNNARSTLGDSVFYFRSSLTPFNPDGGGTSFTTDSTRFMFCTSILTMYQTAYEPYFSDCKTILAMKDTAKFSNRPENVYCYELLIPPNRVKDANSFMQDDLERYFGCRARVEIHEAEVLSLVKGDTLRIETKGGTPIYEASAAGVHLVNRSFSELVYLLDYYLGEHIPVVDDTHMQGQIDIDLITNMLDPEGVKLALKPYGLDLKTQKERIPMLVIYDPREK